MCCSWQYWIQNWKFVHSYIDDIDSGNIDSELEICSVYVDDIDRGNNGFRIGNLFSCMLLLLIMEMMDSELKSCSVLC